MTHILINSLAVIQSNKNTQNRDIQTITSLNKKEPRIHSFYITNTAPKSCLKIQQRMLERFSASGKNMHTSDTHLNAVSVPTIL